MTQGEFIDESDRDDRRSESRTTAVYRPVLLETEDFTGFCLLRNLSSSGLMGEAYTDFAVGEPVNVQFLPGHVVSGKIVWSSHGKIGVEFDKEIDLFGSLEDMGSRYVDTHVNRSPRVPIKCEGHAEIDGHIIKLRLQDISQKGLKAIIPSLRPGDEVTVHLPQMDPRKAVVRWTQSEVAGLNFLRPIGFEELARWVIGQQSESDDERAFG
jgi:hypothetical protein